MQAELIGCRHPPLDVTRMHLLAHPAPTPPTHPIATAECDQDAPALTPNVNTTDPPHHNCWCVTRMHLLSHPTPIPPTYLARATQINQAAPAPTKPCCAGCEEVALTAHPTHQV